MNDIELMCSANFRDGRSVQELIDNMRSGSVVPDDLPALRVFDESGKIYSLDNRRLFAAKESKSKVNVEFVDPQERSVAKEIKRKFSTINDGESIIVKRRKE